MAATTLFTYGPANVDALLATTKSVIAQLGDFLSDQIFLQIPLLNWLEQKAKITKSGGASILVPLMFAKNTTVKAYAGFDILDTTPQEGLTMAQFAWSNYAVSISISGDEERANMGEGKLTDLVKAKTMQSVLTLRDRIDIDMFVATQVSKGILNLPSLVDATSTIANVNSTTNSWWQGQVVASGSFAGRGLADLRNAYNLVSRQGIGGGAPDILVTTQAVLEFYEASQVSNIRYDGGGGNKSLADAGFENMKFKGAVVTFDANAASGELYMLRSDNLKFCVHSQANFSVGKFKEPVNQDAKAAQVLWMGQLVTNNRRKLAKLTGITA